MRSRWMFAGTPKIPLTLNPSSADSRGIRREAIVVVGAFFSELEPILSTLSVIAAALKATRRAGAPTGRNVALSRVPRVA